MKKNASPKQHHFVPKWYLDGFTDPQSGFLHIYDKKIGKYRKQKPDKVMRINNYYKQEWAREGIDPNILEKRAGEWMEPQAKNAFERLFTMPNDFTSQETAFILLYLEFQRVRVPRQARIAKQLIESSILKEADSEFTDAFLKGQITISESVRFQYMREVSGKIMPYFTRMKWDIVRASKDSSFITSDSPVSFYNQEFLPPLEAGLRLAGTKVLFPLNSELLLIMRHPEYGTGSDVSPTMLVPEPEDTDNGIEIDFYPQPILAPVVNQYNWVLAELSDRLVVGNCREVLESSIRAASVM